MIKLLYKDKTYHFPPLNQDNYIFGKYYLSNNWRTKDLKNGDDALDIRMRGDYTMTEKSYRELKQYGFFGSYLVDNGFEDEDALTEFFIDSLSIGHSKMNYQTFNYELVGNVKNHFPTFQELENLKLSDAICSKSYLALSCFGVEEMEESLKVSEIQFGKIKDHKISLFYKAQFELNNEIGHIIIEENLPFLLWFEISGAKDEFVGLDAEERFKEIEACIEKVYDSSKYEKTKTITNQETLRCEIVLRGK